MATPTREPLAAYAAYRRSMLQAIPDAEPDRLNAYIALQMRKAGFTREVVEDTLFQCAPQTWPEPTDRDWRRYAQRMATYAVGIGGDMSLARGLAAKAQETTNEEGEDRDIAPAAGGRADDRHAGGREGCCRTGSADEDAVNFSDRAGSQTTSSRHSPYIAIHTV